MQKMNSNTDETVIVRLFQLLLCVCVCSICVFVCGALMKQLKLHSCHWTFYFRAILSPKSPPLRCFLLMFLFLFVACAFKFN